MWESYHHEPIKRFETGDGTEPAGTRRKAECQPAIHL